MRWWLAVIFACGSGKEPVAESTPKPVIASAPRLRTIRPPSRERAVTFAAQFAIAWPQCRSASLVDYEEIVARALARRPIPGAVAHEYAEKLSKPTSSCPPQFLEPGVVAYLPSSSPRPLIRVVVEAEGLLGVEYFELELDERPDGIRVVDFYTYSNGEWFSDTVVAILAGIEAAAGEGAEVLGQATALARAGQFVEADAMYGKLPASLRATKRITLMHLAVIARVDSARFAAEAEAFAAKHPGDPSVDLIGIRAAGIHGRHEAVQRAIDRIDARVGHDPFLDAIRALAAIGAGKTEDAIRLIERAVEHTPDILPVWKMRAWIELQAGRKAAGRKTLDAIRDRFGEPAAAALRAEPRFATLLNGR